MLYQLTRTLLPHSETPSLDAQTLLAHIHAQNTAWVLAHPNAPLDPAQTENLNNAITQLQNGVPLPYVIGHWEFYGQDFIVSPDVLIPRPETEELVEKALDWLRPQKNTRALDMGTGSGCIPVILARNVPDLHMVGVDLSNAALKIARQNADKHGVAARIALVRSDLWRALENWKSKNFAGFNLITANLPYIPSATLKTLAVYTREPTIALDGGADGLDLIRRFLKDAPHFLAPKGMVLLEIDSSHGLKALQLAKEFFPNATIKLQKDYSDRDRFIKIQTP